MTTSRIEKLSLSNPSQTRGIAQLGASLEVGHGRHQSAGEERAKEREKRGSRRRSSCRTRESTKSEGVEFLSFFFCTLRLFSFSLSSSISAPRSEEGEASSSLVSNH